MKNTKKHPFVTALLNGEYSGISKLAEPEDRQSAQKYEDWMLKNSKKTDSSLLAEFQQIKKIASRLLVKYTLEAKN